MGRKVVGMNDPLGRRIMAQVEWHKRDGTAYPTRRVDDLGSVPKVWMGKTAYDPTTLERLRLSSAGRRRPIDLPDDFILDGDRRLPKERDEQYRRYCTYRDLGADRTVAAAARACGVTGSSADWRVLASRYHWQERVALWDSELSARVQVAMEKKIDAVIDQHAERRTTFLEREINIVDKTYTRLEEMLSVPAIDRYVETLSELGPDGRTIIKHVTHWHAVNWSYGDIARLVGEIDKIARLHYGMPTSNTAMKIGQTGTISVVQTGASHDFSHMSPEERAMHQYAAARADDAYFAALAEFKSRQSAQPPLALVH